jgi:hypothetical protein
VQRATAAPSLAQAIASRGQRGAIAQRSLDASADRWQALIESVVHTPAARPAQTPRASQTTGGFLSRLRVPEGAAEMLRRAARRQFTHASAGEEWPPYFAES